ncbi:MAG: cupredoxin domain-containing protein [bacterium]
MTVPQIVVTLGGLALAVFVIWFFFFSKKEAARAEVASGVQEIGVRVKGGYSPDVIVVEHGKPVRINFYRQETVDCSERVLFPDFNKSALLTPYETVAVEFTPEKPGEYEFTCGMGMLRGKLIVE